MAEYREANRSLVRLAQSDLDGFLRSLNLNGSPAAVREALLEFFPELVATYGATSATLGADFYDMLRDVPPSSASFRAASAQAVKSVQAEGSARWALGALFSENPDLFASRLSGATQRLVLQPFRETVETSAARDPVRSGVARIPSGPTTCKWCVMIASRGAVYTAETAAGAWHDHCDCMPTVIRSSDDYPEGHDVDRFRRLYADQVGIGRDIPVNP